MARLRTSEVNIGHQDADPVQRAEDCDQTNKVSKDSGGRFRDVHVAKRYKQRSSRNTVEWYACLGGSLKDLRSLAFFGE